MKSKRWFLGYIIVSVIPLLIIALATIIVDPFFHYHKPDTSKYYYDINNERSQNDGILRHFDYDGIITGTSMTQNFKASEAERLFGYSFVKTCFSGGTYKEINENLSTALSVNPDIKIIIRGIDTGNFLTDKDTMRFDLGDYPTYLYNRNPLDDVKYVLNRDVFFLKVCDMVNNSRRGVAPGITSFDQYGNWMAGTTFGMNALLPDGIPTTEVPAEVLELTDEEREGVIQSVRQNITSLAVEYPDVTFYYFFTPYSAAWWQSQLNAGALNKQIQAEQIVIEEILKVDNVKLYSWNDQASITTDLNNYKDTVHYGEWINSLMLHNMKEDIGLITESNYLEYLESERELYLTLDYQECFGSQEDYEDDYFVVGQMNR